MRPRAPHINRPQRRVRGRSAFTLIETMIGLTILGVTAVASVTLALTFSKGLADSDWAREGTMLASSIAEEIASRSYSDPDVPTQGPIGMDSDEQTGEGHSDLSQPTNVFPSELDDVDDFHGLVLTYGEGYTVEPGERPVFAPPGWRFEVSVEFACPTSLGEPDKDIDDSGLKRITVSAFAERIDTPRAVVTVLRSRSWDRAQGSIKTVLP